MDVCRTNQVTPLVTSITPFSSKRMNALYPESKIKLRPLFELHFLVALGKSHTIIEDYAKKYPKRILCPDSEILGLTPMHVVALKGDVVTAKIFLSIAEQFDIKSILNTKSKIGFTPMHLAALTSDELFSLFMQHGGDSNLLTTHGASCQKLRILAGRVVEGRSSLSLYYQEGSEQKPALLSSDPVLREQVFGKDFYHTESIIWPSECYQELFEPLIVRKLDAFSEICLVFSKNPPKLIIAPCEELKKVTPHFLEVRSMDRIEPGNIIAEGAGQKYIPVNVHHFLDYFSEPYKTDSIYRCFGLDARRVGNESRFFNCGFPNAFVEQVLENGSTRILVISKETIEPGEPILIDYGMDSAGFMFSAQVILGKKRIVNFYEKNGARLYAIVQEAEKTRNECVAADTLDMSAICEWQHIRAAFLFPINNPTALLFLHFRNLFDYTTLPKAFESQRIKLLSNLVSNTHIQHIHNIIGILKLIKKKYSGKDKKAISEWILQRLEKIPLTEILKALDLIAKGKSLKEIEKALMGYDWTNDPEHPFSYQRRLKNLQECYRNLPSQDLIIRLQPMMDKLDKQSELYKMFQEILKRGRKQ